MKNFFSLNLIVLAFVSLQSLFSPSNAATNAHEFQPTSSSAHETVFSEESRLNDLKKSILVLREKIKDSHCTAFAISPDGYFMTALHCVRTCLTVLNKADQGSSAYLGLHDLFVVHNPMSPDAQCKYSSLEINGAEKSIDVVATGSALSNFNSTFLMNSRKYFRELNSSGWVTKGNDFAIFKVDVQEPIRCLRFSDDITTGISSANHKVFAMGYPGADYGMKQGFTVTPGIEFSRPSDSNYYKALKGSDEKVWTRVVFGSSDIIFSDAEVAEGQSGGPILNSKDQVVGLTSGFLSSPIDEVRKKRELVGVRLSHLLAKISPSLKEELVEKNKSCH